MLHENAVASSQYFHNLSLFFALSAFLLLFKAMPFCQFAVMLSSLWTRFVLEFTVDHLDNQEVHSCAMA